MRPNECTEVYFTQDDTNGIKFHSMKFWHLLSQGFFINNLDKTHTNCVSSKLSNQLKIYFRTEKKYINVCKNTETCNVLLQDLYSQICVTSTILITVVLKTTK